MKEKNFTKKTSLLLKNAKNIALELNNQRMNTLHLLKSAIKCEGTVLSIFIEKKLIDENLLLSYVDHELDKLPKIKENLNIILDEDLMNLIKISESISIKNGDDYLSSDWLIASLSKKGFKSSQAFENFNVSYQMLEEEILQKRNGTVVTNQFEDSNQRVLKKFTKDLTDLAMKGKIDPIIGRDDEIRRTIQVLSRRTKNNPVLIGEPGVGKTAIAEGLAMRIISLDVPQYLIGKKLLSLDVGLLIAGAKFRGEFEERIKHLLKEVNDAKGDIIIFIDEMHTLIGAGKSEGSMDASNLFKPALARGELHCLSATTLVEYQKYVEKDAALARRFQTIFVNAPNINDTVSILRGIKEKYELHHGVKILDSSLVSAVKLSERYIVDRQLPDKAIDLIDEASSRVRLELDSKPEGLDKLDREILQKQIELEAIRSNNEHDTEERLKEIQEILIILKKKSNLVRESWEKEQKQHLKFRDFKNQLDQLKINYEEAKRKGNLVLAGELAYSKIPNLERKISEIENSKLKKSSDSVTPFHIASVIEKWTSIPTERMMSEDKVRFLKMEKILSKQIIGQENPIKSVSNAVKRSKAGLNDENRPLSSFLFLGPTGVGKTELSKALANFLFEENISMTRIDMSEYMEKHNVSKLIGAPPGYVGYDERGVLTEAIRRRPYQVVLFDEVEKAHQDVFNLLLQILDEGRVTDSHGTLVDFKNTIIIMTSNLGSKYYYQNQENSKKNDLKMHIMKEVNSFFKPEFLNRLDEILIFDNLTKENIGEIIDIKLNELFVILRKKNISISLSDDVKKYLKDLCFDPLFGARPIKRILQKQIVDKIAEIILNRNDEKKINLKISLENDVLTFST